MINDKGMKKYEDLQLVSALLCVLTLVHFCTIDLFVVMYNILDLDIPILFLLFNFSCYRK